MALLRWFYRRVSLVDLLCGVRCRSLRRRKRAVAAVVAAGAESKRSALRIQGRGGVDHGHRMHHIIAHWSRGVAVPVELPQQVH